MLTKIVHVLPIFAVLSIPLLTSDPDDINRNQKHFQSIILWLKYEQVDSLLSKNQVLLSYTTVITIIFKYTMTSKASNVNRGSSLRNV